MLQKEQSISMLFVLFPTSYLPTSYLPTSPHYFFPFPVDFTLQKQNKLEDVNMCSFKNLKKYSANQECS